MVRDLILEQPCKCEPKRKKKCRCFRPNTNNKYWLFSRYSIGWKCGLHADYTVNTFAFHLNSFGCLTRYSFPQELINCVDRVLNQVEHIGSHPMSSVIRDRFQRNKLLSSSSLKEIAIHRPPDARRYFLVTLLRDPIARFV